MFQFEISDNKKDLWHLTVGHQLTTLLRICGTLEKPFQTLKTFENHGFGQHTINKPNDI